MKVEDYKRRRESNDEWVFVIMIVVCVIWLIWQDIAYLLPVMGILGGLKALEEIKNKELREKVEKKIKRELPHLSASKEEGDHIEKTLIDGLARSVGEEIHPTDPWFGR
jgi:hypothetical protein